MLRYCRLRSSGAGGEFGGETWRRFLRTDKEGVTVNVRQLKALMALHEDNITTLARKMGIARSTLSDKLNGRCSILVRDVQAITEIYKLNAQQMTEIFFPDDAMQTVFAPNGQQVPVIEMGKPVPDSFLQWFDEKEAAEKVGV